MAEFVLVGRLFAFLLINTCHGFPGLEGLSEDTTENSGFQVQLMDYPKPEYINMMIAQRPRYKCHQHQCEPPNCSESTSFCESRSCYKSSARDEAGEIHHSRGCSTDDHVSSCGARPGGDDRWRHAKELNVTCCMGDLCNGGDFPPLPEHDTAVEPIRPKLIDSAGRARRVTRAA